MKTRHENIKQVIEYVQQNIDRDINLNEVCKMFYYTEATLKRHFNEATGTGLRKYYLNRKMQLAEAMVTEKKMTLSGIATALGFQNRSYFTEVFEKYNRCLPSKMK